MQENGKADKRKPFHSNVELQEDAFRRICSLPASRLNLSMTLTSDWNMVFVYIQENEVGPEWKSLLRQRESLLREKAAAEYEYRTMDLACKCKKQCIQNQSLGGLAANAAAIATARNATVADIVASEGAADIGITEVIRMEMV